MIPPATSADSETGPRLANGQTWDERGRAALDELGATWQWAGATGSDAPDGSETFEVFSPLTGTRIGTLPKLDVVAVRDAARRARKAQRAWALLSVRERAQRLLAVHDLVWKRCDALLDVVQWETGKARAHAFEEVADVAMTAGYLARTAHDHLQPKRVAGTLSVLTHTVVRRAPKGVVAVIAPWNYPLTLVASDAMAALVAGNAVLLKPDSQTPFTALAVQSLFIRAGIDPDLFQVLPGSGAQLGPALIDEADSVMFTGSTATGASVAERAGRRLVSASAELGGKNPMIVCADAPMSRAVRGAVRACFSNAGQLCISIERIFVIDEAWDRFVPAFTAAVGQVSVGADMGWETGIGPLISREHAKKVDAHVRDAVSKGATLLAGGHFLPDVAPSAYAPTLLTDVRPDMTLFAEETFGPVVALYRVASEDAAIEAANATRYGLNASVWTRDTRRGQAIAAALECGTVNVNEGYVAAWASQAAPMGGMKDSGLGRRHGSEGVLKYTEAQTIATQRLLNIQAPPGVGEHTWARAMRLWLQAQRRLPFL